VNESHMFVLRQPLTFTLSADSANVRALLEALCSAFTLREMDRDDS